MVDEDPMDGQRPTDGRSAAEEYRIDRQSAEARNNGFGGMPSEAFLAWATENRPHLEAIARANGAEEADAPTAVDEYLKILQGTTQGGPFDDLNVSFILEGVVHRVEAVCLRGGVPVREGVAYGVQPKMGLEASQLAVMGTSASIITVSQGFPPFCNLISKAVALSMVPKGGSMGWDSIEVLTRLRQTPKLQIFWTQIFSSYALDGWPPTDIEMPLLDPLQQWVRLQVLQAMELFAVAHEYGHHVLKHGESQATNETRDHFSDEHEADVFGRLICLNEGLESTPPNLFTASGAGAVLMLGGIELVRRTKAVLETGVAKPSPRRSHPPLDERLAMIAGGDQHANETDRAVFEDMRQCARQLLESVWSVVEPVVTGMHQNGFRPQALKQDVGGWLPDR
jgi:hypothetical protein